MRRKKILSPPKIKKVARFTTEWEFRWPIMLDQCAVIVAPTGT
jgi:hypothetical protein